MKVKLDFVANSSSTSFTIAVKGDLSNESVLQALGVPEDSLLHSLAKSIADYMVGEAEVFDLDFEIRDYGYANAEEAKANRWLAKFIDLLDRGFTVYRGSASYNEGSATEQLIGNSSIKYEDENLIIRSGEN